VRRALTPARPGLFVALLVVVSASPAAAHGGSPVALELLGDGPFADRTLETTFGVIRQEAGGAWTLSCEEAVSPGWKDYVRLPGGRVGMAHGRGFAWSDDLCSFQEATGMTGGGVEAHVAIDASGARLFVLSDSLSPGRNLLVSLDGGESFEPVATPEGWLATGLVVAADGTGRVAVAAQGPNRAQGVLLSDSREAAWRVVSLPPTTGLYLVASIGPSGLFVLRSEDGLLHLLHVADGVATSVDTPAEPAALVDLSVSEWWLLDGDGRLWRSDGPGTAWHETPPLPRVTCLVPDGTDRLACVYATNSTVAVMRTRDGGASWQPVLEYADVGALRTCPSESDVGRTCVPMWGTLSYALSRAPDAWNAPKAPERPCGCSGGAAGATLWIAIAAIARRRRPPLVPVDRPEPVS